MADERISSPDLGLSDGERGIAIAERQTSLARNSTSAPPQLAKSAGKKAEKGVFFLLSAEGFRLYAAESGSEGESNSEERVQSAAVFKNAVAFARSINSSIKVQAKLAYDPLELRYFTSLSDLLGAKPGRDVANGRWASAAILTHSTFQMTQQGRRTVTEPGLWVTPAGVFSGAMREFGGSDDPTFADFRECFEPSATLHVFACGGMGEPRELACATRRLFGVRGDTYVPRGSIQVREGGKLYFKLDSGRYRPFDVTTDMAKFTNADC